MTERSPVGGAGVAAVRPRDRPSARAQHDRALSRRCWPAQRYASGFNPTLAGADPRAWVSRGHYGLDQGIVVMMIENYRTQLIWRLMRDCPFVATGLRRAGFRGGWL